MRAFALSGFGALALVRIEVETAAFNSNLLGVSPKSSR